MALIKYINEYDRLRRLALYRPSLAEIDQRDPAQAMYIATPDPQRVQQEFDGIVAKLQDLGVEVVVLEPQADTPQTNNMIFLRDVACAYRDKLVLANMKHPLRQQEPQKFKALLSAYDTEYADCFVDLDANATMEGADIFVSGDHLYVYAGSRTSSNVCQLMPSLFAGSRATAIAANIDGVPQHILGGVHILDDHTASRRTQYCTDTLEGYSYIDFDEDDEITKGFSLNIITVAPREILMPANNPATKQKLEAAGITCHEVPVHEIHKMGGGLACMALPLWRES